MTIAMDPLLVLPALLRQLIARVPADRRAGDLALVEHVWHLADLEDVFRHRIERLARETAPRLPDIDGARLARSRNYIARDIYDGLGRFERERAATVARFARLDAHQRRRTGVLEGVGPIELGDLPVRILAHERSHARELAVLATPRLAAQLAVFARHGDGSTSAPKLDQSEGAAKGRTVRSPCGPRASYLPRLCWLVRTRELVARAILGGDVPSLAATAGRVGMNARSLQRRLQAQGLGFRCLLEETRQQLAVVRLARGDDVAQLGAQLGYADRRTAVRAFRRWGISPAYAPHAAATAWSRRQ
jgi:AraC-like DNA-binding protein